MLYNSTIRVIAAGMSKSVSAAVGINHYREIIINRSDRCNSGGSVGHCCTASVSVDLKQYGNYTKVEEILNITDVGYIYYEVWPNDNSMNCYVVNNVLTSSARACTGDNGSGVGAYAFLYGIRISYD